MQPQFQTSFIPKKPVFESQKNNLVVVKSRNIFSIIANFMFIITILASGGLFGYKFYLSKQISEADTTLNEARAAFDTNKIQDLLNASTRITTVKTILEKHYIVSELLVLLQQLTNKNIHFDELSFRANDNNVLSLNIGGESSTYNALAVQSDTLKDSGFFKNETFSDFSLTDKGAVRFRYTANVIPELVSYKKVIDLTTIDQ